MLTFIGQFDVKEGVVVDTLIYKYDILKDSAKIDILLESVFDDVTLINLRGLGILRMGFDIADDTDFMGLEQIDILISVGLWVILMQRWIYKLILFWVGGRMHVVLKEFMVSCHFQLESLYLLEMLE